MAKCVKCENEWIAPHGGCFGPIRRPRRMPQEAQKGGNLPTTVGAGVSQVPPEVKVAKSKWSRAISYVDGNYQKFQETGDQKYWKYVQNGTTRETYWREKYIALGGKLPVEK